VLGVAGVDALEEDLDDTSSGLLDLFIRETCFVTRLDGVVALEELRCVPRSIGFEDEAVAVTGISTYSWIL
jgi:hypothetical protein